MIASTMYTTLVGASSFGCMRRVAVAKASLMAMKAVIAASVQASLLAVEESIEWLEDVCTFWDKTVVEINESKELMKFAQ